MIIDALLILLPIAAALGWFAARRGHSATPSFDNERFNRDYLAGLNYLLNEQPDKAIDIFIKMLEVDSETVETHLALGALFRRRGEVSRAIRIHQNLIARPHLSKEQRIDALLALGLDYLRAGMFDRAERVFLEVIDSNSPPALVAKRNLLDIYQQQKRWDQAIMIANKLERANKEIGIRIAHYHCEQAEFALRQDNSEQARANLRQAFSANPYCVRASLLQGTMEFKAGDAQAALQAYQRVKEQDPHYLNEIVTPLTVCYQKLGKPIELLAYLQECLEEYPRASIALTLMENIQAGAGDAAAIEFMTHQMHRYPSLRGLQQLLLLQLKSAEDKARENLEVLKEFIDRLLKSKTTYRCHQCGYAGRALHWLCPGCKNWETIKPILGVEGE